MPDINMRHFEELQRNQHSIDVEIDASQVASPQQDFPMMLETPNSSNSVLNVVAINELGEQLPTEIEGVANDKNWVYLKGLVQSVANRKMKVFYGGSGGKPIADSTYGSQAVWDINYVGVWHMNHDPSGAAPQLLDSTLNNNDGASYGAMTSGDLVDGDYGKGIDFDGAGDGFSITDSDNSMDTTGDISVIARLETRDISRTSQSILSKRDGSAVTNNYISRIATDSVAFNFYNGAWYSFEDTYALSNNVKYAYGITYDAVTVRAYVDGNAKTTLTHNKALLPNNFPVSIGSYTDGAEAWNGVMYEVRLSTSERSANYITTTHNNLNNPTANGTNPFYKSISKELNFVESLQSLGRAG